MWPGQTISWLGLQTVFLYHSILCTAQFVLCTQARLQTLAVGLVRFFYGFQWVWWNHMTFLGGLGLLSFTFSCFSWVSQHFSSIFQVLLGSLFSLSGPSVSLVLPCFFRFSYSPRWFKIDFPLVLLHSRNCSLVFIYSPSVFFGLLSLSWVFVVSSVVHCFFLIFCWFVFVS